MVEDIKRRPSRFKRNILILIIILCIWATVYVNVILGYDTFYTHLFYIPIILTSWWYYKKGLALGLLLGLTHITISYFMAGHFIYGSLIRLVLFLGVARVVCVLAEKAHVLYKKLNHILESTDEAIVGMDLEGQCTFANRSTTKMTGYSFEELKGRSVHNLIHSPMNNAESCLAENCCVLQSMKTGIGCRVRDDIFWRKDGSYFPVEYSSYPIFDNEQITGAVVTFNDITERKKADDELRDAKEQADLYLDLLGHDINNMNQVCISYLEIAQHKLELKNEQKMLIRHPLETMKISSKLIHNVMQIRNAKTNNLHQQIIDLGMILSEAKAQFKIVPNKDVTINYNPVSGCRVIASELLRDVFANIIGNAIKHSGPSVTINMGVAKIEHHGRTSYKVTIEDNGPGINQELKQLVFNKFTKGPTTAKSTGLGLYLSKTLIEQFQGMIQVEDRIPGDHTQGSKFVVIIPTAD